MFLECCRASALRLSSARKDSKISDANVVGLVFLQCCRTSVLRLSGARNASKISDVIFVSDASNASLAKVETLCDKTNISSDINDVINAISSVALVMF